MLMQMNSLSLDQLQPETAYQLKVSCPYHCTAAVKGLIFCPDSHTKEPSLSGLVENSPYQLSVHLSEETQHPLAMSEPQPRVSWRVKTLMQAATLCVVMMLSVGKLSIWWQGHKDLGQ